MSGEPRILVIGAGPTGLGAAWRLHERGYRNWKLVEAAGRAGGLASSCVDGQGFTWDLGGHVLFSHYEYFDRLMDDLLGDAWVEHTREAWVWMRERFIPYPLQYNIRYLDSEDLIPCIEGLFECLASGPEAQDPRTFRDWILHRFGSGLAEVFMLPYNFKVWAYDPGKLDVGWMGERVAPVDVPRVVRNLTLKQDDRDWGPNASFRFPLRGGTGSIWQALVERLPTDHLLFDSPIREVRPQEKRLVYSDGSSDTYDFVISSMPLDALLLQIRDREDLAARAAEFIHSSTNIVGIGVQGQAPERLRSKCWMYFPEADVPFYRVTVFSNYSPNNVPCPGKQWSLLAEVSESADKPVRVHQVVEDVVAGLVKAQLLSSKADIISRWHRRLEYAYPTPFLGRDALLNDVETALREHHILSRGRFGGWKYEVSNQDHSLMQGVEAVDHVLDGAEETTYRLPEVVNARKDGKR